MSGKTPQEILQAFLKAEINSVSRERIFHNKLFFDLKLAAARCRYALALFEPEVDRDAFDVFLDDGDNERRIQVKTVLASARTANWYSTKRFMRPEEVYGQKLGWPPADCGVGGGFVLIEIDDATADAAVSYHYTDYFVASALADRLILEKPAPLRTRRGRPKLARHKQANDFLSKLSAGPASSDIRLHRSLFLQPQSSDALLAILNLHNNTNVYLAADKILSALDQRLEVDEQGDPTADADKTRVRLAQAHIEYIFGLLNEPSLKTFNAPPWPDAEETQT
jgi:hypothetical protein